MTSFPDFTLFFVQKHSRLYNKKKNTRRLKDTNFIFLVVKKKQNNILLTRFCFHHSKITLKFISLRRRVISTIYTHRGQD